MRNYKIRKATLADISFLTETIIAAEKSNSGKLSFTTLFDLPEDRVSDLIRRMFEEEIDGCEFSVSSFLVTEYENKVIAAFGGWIEAWGEEIPSKILKSNLINFTFNTENLALLKSRSYIISDVLIEREKGTLQLEYLFVNEQHRGKGVGDNLIREHIKKALLLNIELQKVQVQLFANNHLARTLYERNGFYINKLFKSENVETLQYLPYNEKFLMEKKLR